MRKMVLTIMAIALFSVGAHAADTKIRFGILPVIDTLPLQVGVHDGLFAEQGWMWNLSGSLRLWSGILPCRPDSWTGIW